MTVYGGGGYGGPTPAPRPAPPPPAPPAAQGGTGGPPILPPGGLPSPVPAAQGGTGGPPILPPGGLGGGPSGPSPAQQQAAAQRQQIVNSLIHQASSWGASNGIPFALQAQLLAGAASKYQIPLNAMLGIYGQETSFGQNVTYSGVGPGQGATGPFQFESFNFGKYGYPGTNKPTPSQFAQQVDAFGKYLVANNSSKDPNGYAPAMGGGYSQQQANSTLSGIPHGLAAAVSAVTGGKIPAVDPAKAAAALRTAAANAPPALVPGSIGGATSATTSSRPRRFYVNPFASAQGLSPERIDMGVDYAAKAGSPIGAIGAAKILSAAPGGTGWTSPTNTQAGVVYQLLQGPMKGRDVYVTEDIAPTVKAGDVVPAGGQIAKFLPSGTGIETGWATGQGFGSLAASLNQQAQGGDPGGHASASGANFSNLLAALGAPAGVANGAPNGTMPPGYFQSGAAGASGAPLPSSSFSSSGGAPSSGGATVAPSGSTPAAPSGDSSGAQAQAQTQQQALLAQLMNQGQGPQSTLQSLLASSPGNLWNTMPSGGADAFAGLSGGDMAGLLGLAQTSLQSLVPNMKLRGLGAIPLP